MVTDIHFHLGGVRNSEHVHISKVMRNSLSFRAICAILFLHKGRISNSAAEAWAEEVVRSAQKVDRVVALALDWVYDEHHNIDKSRTHYRVSNELTKRFCAKLPNKILYGASVNPNSGRKDALARLQEAYDNGAVLIKLIPSAQDIDLADTKHIPYFDLLAKLHLPLLVHVGVEHTIPPVDNDISKQRLNDPKRLELALSRGVCVIAGHCGLPIQPKDGVEAYRQLKALFRNDDYAQHLYADVSAFFIPYPSLRAQFVDEILDGALPHERLVLGSDFPLLPGPLTGGHTNGMDFGEMVAVLRTRNPLDKNVAALQAKGFSDCILSNADMLLRKGKIEF